MDKYKCIFFDLDHTLWDYETNSVETLGELYEYYNLQSRGVELLEQFVQSFRAVNFRLWDLYDRGLINSDVIRRERFKQILEPFMPFEEKLCESLSVDYLNRCPQKCNLIPGAIETLEYLHGHYNLTVVTNGFEEIQNLKLTSGNLHQYFDHIITSQKAGYKKPAKEIFEFALNINDVMHDEAIMIGDNPVTDIGGAANASIDAVLFNPEQLNHNVSVKYEITSLGELKGIL